MSELNLEPGRTRVPPWEYVPEGPYDLVVADSMDIVGRFYGPDLDDAVRIVAEDALPLRPFETIGFRDSKSRLILYLRRDHDGVTTRGCRVAFECLARHYDPVLALDFELSAKECNA